MKSKKQNLFPYHLFPKINNSFIILFFSFILITGCSNAQSGELQDELDKTTSQYEELQKDYKNLKEDYQSLQTEHENLQLQIGEYQDQQATIDDLNNQLAELQKQNNTLQAEKESLASQVASLQASQVQNNTPPADNTMVVQAAPAPTDNGGGAMVWLSETGSKYHSINNCGRMNPNKARQVSQASAEASGYERCSKCF